MTTWHPAKTDKTPTAAPNEHGDSASSAGRGKRSPPPRATAPAAAHCYPYVFLTLLEDLEGARISSPTWSGI